MLSLLTYNNQTAAAHQLSQVLSPKLSPRSDEITTIINIALQAYREGLLGLQYYNNGSITSIKSDHEIIFLIRNEGFTIQNVEGKFYLTRGLLGGAPPQYKTTKELADQLKNTDLSDSSYEIMQTLALKVIDNFAQTPSKTKPLIEEVTALAFANNTVITKSLLKVLIKELNQSELLDIDILIAIKTTLINSSIDALDPDDLLKVLKIANAQITLIHQQGSTSYKLYAALGTIADILDVMNDANVMKVGRIDTHDPLYKTLDSFSSSDDILIASPAAYAKQALVRVPNDESKARSALRHGRSLVQGLSSLYQVISNQDILALVDAYENFKDAIDFQEGKKSWYADVRILKLLIEKKLYDTFTRVIENRMKETNNLNVAGNVLVMMHDVVHSNPSQETRRWAIDIMADLFLNDARWGDKKSLKENVLDQIRECLSLPDQATSAYAREILDKISSQSTTKLHKKLIEEALRNTDLVRTKTVRHVDTPTTALITSAQRSDYLSLEQKIRLLKEETLKDKDILGELASYIPVLGSRCLFDPKEQTFDLDKTVNEFLQGNKKVFLLLGDSGGGKSTYLRHLENSLWKQWTPEKPIPLFISLPSLNQPFKDAIAEALTEKGFTETEQNELKGKYSFLFLMDGYDELKQKKNLYIANQLHKWKAQTIITCRTQHLIGEQSSYHSYFSPNTNGADPTFLLDEASTSPFTTQQIESYYRKYADVNKDNIQRTWEQFKADINSIPDLVKIIETPFLLKIVAEVLPSLIELHQYSNNKEKLNLLRIEIFDAFVKRWFNREEARLQKRTDVEVNVPDIKKAFYSFATQLAIEMIKDNLTAVVYEESSDPFSESTSKWKKFFGPDPQIAIIRSGVPLRKTGPHSYSFIHKSLLEYFGTRAIISNPIMKPSSEKTNEPPASQPAKPKDVQSDSTLAITTSSSIAEASSSRNDSQLSESISFESLNSKILTKEPEIIRLLAECVTKTPSLQKILFEFIERSKQDKNAAIAAANAITILNAAEVNLSKKDFRGIRISEADLSHAIITGTDFSHSDLRNVNLNGAILDNSTIANCEVEGLDLGQKPFIKLSGSGPQMVFSPDAKWIAYTGNDGVVQIRDIQSAKDHIRWLSEIRTDDLLDHTGTLIFSSDGKMLLSGRGYNYKLTDLQTRNIINQFNIWSDRAFFHPDSKAILFQNKHSLSLVSCQTKDVCLELKDDKVDRSQISDIKFSPDGKWMLTLSEDGTISIWDMETYKVARQFSGADRYISCLGLSPDGKLIAVQSEDYTVHLLDIQSGNVRHRLSGHRDHINCLAFSPDGARLLSGGYDTTVRLWDCQTGKQLQVFPGNSHEIACVKFSSDGEWAYSGSVDGTVRTWNLSNLQKSALQKTKDLPFNDFIVSPDGTLAFCTNRSSIHANFRTGESLIHLVNTLDGKDQNSYQAASNKNLLAISPNKKFCLFSNKNQVELCELSTGKVLKSFTKHKEEVICAAFSPDGNYAISSGKDNIIRLWDCQTGNELRTFNELFSFMKMGDHSTYFIEFSQDGKYILSVGIDGVRLWDSQSGKKVISISASFKGDCFDRACISSQGKSILVAETFGDLHLWDVKSGTKTQSFKAGGFARSVAISPDARWAFSGHQDGTIQVWDCSNGNQLYSLNLGNSIDKMTMMPDGKRLLVITHPPALQMWELFNEKRELKPSLLWKKGYSALSSQQLNIDNVKGLSESNHKLLLQHGAKTPSTAV